MSDDRVPEFNLDGKQLVFLVISGIGVAVVVFLCGVMVGRGVPAVARDAADPIALVGAAAGDAGVPLDAPATTGDVSLAPEAVPYPDRTGSVLPPEPLGDPIASRQAVTPPRPAPPSAARVPEPAPASTASRSARFEVQVMSLRGEAEADAVARSLKSKGYSAFVSATNERGGMYRVRVGGFADRPSAQAVVDRLSKEEQYKPWIDTVR